MEEIGNYMLLDETDNSLITEEKLFLLENCARNIRDNLLSLEKTIGAIGNEELKSCISQLKSCFDKFFMKLNNLDSYFEYLQKKEISVLNKKIKETIEFNVREKKRTQNYLRKIEKVEEVSRMAISMGISSVELLDDLKKLEQLKQELEKHRLHAEKYVGYINNAKQMLFKLLGLEGVTAEDVKVLRNYEKFVAKYEHDFAQLQKYLEKIVLLWERIKILFDRSNTFEKNHSGDFKSEYVRGEFSGSTQSGAVKIGDVVPKELNSVFEELKKKDVDNARLMSILQKIYKGNKVIPMKYIHDWIFRYDLLITSLELKSILSKVFAIKEVDKEGGDVSEDQVEVDKKVVVDDLDEGIVNFENQDLKDLQGIYVRLKNKEVDSKELYYCFLGILKKYLSLKISDEELLIKQFKSFEKHNYFYRDILSVSEGIIEKNMTPTIITKNAKCAVTGKVIKFPIGLHSKVRLIITDDNEIVGLYSHADYIRYFGWSRER